MSDAVSRWEDKRWVKDICRHRKIESDFQSPIVEIVSNRALIYRAKETPQRQRKYVP